MVGGDHELLAAHVDQKQDRRAGIRRITFGKEIDEHIRREFATASRRSVDVPLDQRIELGIAYL